jgi:tRNA/tmRNA/rRNA uracil-C5-methylase (TrmA/RlmC/RlmD family)
MGEARGRTRAHVARRASASNDARSALGRLLELEIGAVANGGSCVARYEDLVVFVRHTLPGESVRARVTEGRDGDRFWRADAVEILRASPDRVPAPCRWAGPGGCGGCDWQHATPAAQRELKAAVLAEQLRRVGGLELAAAVEELPGAPDGSGWRTRLRFAVDRSGRAGLRRHRSREVVAIDECFIAHPGVQETGVLGSVWRDTAEVLVTVAGSGERAVVVRAEPNPSGRPGRPSAIPPLPADVTALSYWPAGVSAAERVVETVDGRVYGVPAAGFWQVHPAAAQTLVAAVTEALAPRPGDVLLDLYAGSGLFAGALAALVAPGGSVYAVESDAAAVAAARDNLLGVPGVAVVAGRVDEVLAGPDLPEADLIVVDPPRTGLGAEVVTALAARRPRRIAYVSCDPATLARDLATFRDCGYRVAVLRAFDMFPMTHHLEALATLEPL